MIKLPTLYKDKQSIELDLLVLGQALESKAVDEQTMRELLFAEYRLSNPLPDMESERYKLSRLVENDYISQIERVEMELLESQEYVVFGNDIVEEEPLPEIEVPKWLREKLNYNNREKDTLSSLKEDLLRECLGLGVEVKEISNEEKAEIEAKTLGRVKERKVVQLVYDDTNANVEEDTEEEIKIEKETEREEPKELDIRSYVRKNPRCELEEALKHYSKAEIDKALMMGKITKRGTRLHI